MNACQGEVNGINMYTRRQKHHRNVVRGVSEQIMNYLLNIMNFVFKMMIFALKSDEFCKVSCCLGVLIVYWVSLMSAQAAATVRFSIDLHCFYD